MARPIYQALGVLMFFCLATPTGLAADEPSAAIETEVAAPTQDSGKLTLPPAGVTADKVEKQAILRRVFSSFCDTWDTAILETLVNPGSEKKLDEIAHNASLSAAAKETRKASILNHCEKKRARIKQLLAEQKIDFSSVCLDFAVNTCDAAMGWTMEDYRDLEGLARLINRTKTKFPSFANGAPSDAAWMAWGDGLKAKVTPSLEQFVATLDPVMRKLIAEEKGGKFD